MPENLFKLNEKEYILPGTRACQGCGLSLAYRFILKALRENTIVIVPPSCLCVLHGLYPTTSVILPCLNSTFAGSAASASGVLAALQALNKPDITVVAVAGDGGTHDIGLQSLSAAAERGADFIYVCYDNEGYMNTGTQRSSATPRRDNDYDPISSPNSSTKRMSSRSWRLDDIPYIATVSPAYPVDLYDKFVKAKKIKGTRYIHVHTPCPPGWVYAPRETVRLGGLLSRLYRSAFRD